jgi:DNA-directed RNA polymerase specialized sigma24 family protein
MMLSEEALAQLCEAVRAQMPTETPEIAVGDFSDNLVVRIMRRYPPQKDLEDEETPRESCPLEAMEGGLADAQAFVIKQLKAAVESPYFLLVQEVALSNTDTALEKLMKLLESNIRVRGILYRHGLDPDRDYPAVWGKIWESIPKWDGRDFRAYVARIIRNACLDEIARKKRSPKSIDDSDPRDGRPPVQTAAVAAARDALSFLMAVLDEMEASGRIKALDGVIFGLISKGRQVADIVAAFRLSGVPARFAAAVEALGGRTDATGSAILKFLLDGLQPDEVSLLTGTPEGRVRKIARALGRFEDDEERLIAGELAREGLSVKDLERAQRLTTNAINLCINRIRLKVWMAICDRAYDTLRRRGDVDELELAVVANRCQHAPSSGCRMYKDSTCKREIDPADIARKAGLDTDGTTLARRMADLRLKVVEEGLGMNFPDYNACLIERKPVQAKG